MDDKEILKLSDFLPYVLSVVSNEISQKIAYQYQSRFNIDLHQWRVLAVLGENSHLSAQEVSERTAMDKVAVSRAVKKLLHAALLERAFDDEDKRRSILAMTALGQTIYQQIVPIAKAYEKSLIQQLSDDDVKTLTGLLLKLRSANNDISY